jgi:hypothetical protein
MKFARATSRGRWVRALACLFVLAIGSDLALDSNCDGVPAAPVSVALAAASASGAPDDCASRCVPDCFCCSQSLTRTAVVLPPDAGPVGRAQSLPLRLSPAGVRPVPYRPPLHST